MSPDRKLLELAAHAAGLDINFGDWLNASHGDKFLVRGKFDRWNPLIDDGDALRLAVALGLVVDPGSLLRGYATVRAFNGTYTLQEQHGNNKGAALRRAIVRAAAAIQQAKSNEGVH